MKTLYIITGANKGLGKAFYDILMSNPEDNIVISLSRRLSEDQSFELIEKKNNFHFCQIDFSTFKNPSSIKIIKRFKKVVNRVVFINNAGVITPIGLFGQLDLKSIYNSIHVNVVAPTIILNYIIKNFKDVETDLVNISSGAAERSIEGWSIYCSSKAFTKMMFETINIENKANNKLRVFQFDPGVLDTDMQNTIRQEYSFSWQTDFISLKNTGKLKRPIEVAKNILNEVQAS